MSILIIIIISTLLSAFFSGSEIAFVSANKLNIEVEKMEGNRRAKILALFYDKPRSFITSMLVGNNIALVILTYFSVQLLTPYLSEFISSDFIVLLLKLISYS